MLTGFPSVTVTSEPLTEIDLKQEEKEDGGGAIAVTQFPIAEKVVVEAPVLFRMVKHANDFGTRTAAGKLTGMQFGKTIEVTMATPEVVPPYDPNLSAEEAQQRKRDAEQSDQHHINLLSKSGFDGFVVGRYVSCAHSALSEYNVRQLAEAMRDVPKKKGTKEAAKEARPALLLVYEPQKTCMGRLHLKAYVPTPEFAAYSRTSGGTEEFVKSGMKEGGVVAEVPVVVHVSPMAELLFSQLATQPRHSQNSVVAEGELGTFKERGVAQVADFQREVRVTSDMVQRRAFGSDSLKAELLFERIGHQAQYLSNLEIGCAANVDFVRVCEEHNNSKKQ